MTSRRTRYEVVPSRAIAMARQQHGCGAPLRGCAEMHVQISTERGSGAVERR